MLNPYRKQLTAEDAAHLLARTAFGGTSETISRFIGLDANTAFGNLSAQESQKTTNPFDPQDAINVNAAIKITQMHWLFEMIHSTQPLREKLAFFWHNHFPVGIDKVRFPNALLGYLDVLRRFELGRFSELTTEIARTPAMLRYLDNDQNVKGKPNENFARELFELFTLGIGHYTEKDIQEAARAFTGWTFRRLKKKDIEAKDEFIFQKNKHDGGTKTILGKTGNLSGEDVISLAVTHPQTARFLSRKIWTFFISPNPSSEQIEALSDVWRGSSGNLEEIFRVVFTSEVFFTHKKTLIKSPLDFVVGALRGLNFPVQEEKFYRNLLQVLTGLGHAPFDPPNVSGWEGGRSWISDGALLTRTQIAATMTMNKRATEKNLSLALLGQDKSPLTGLLDHLTTNQQAYLMLVSPEFNLL